MGFLKDFKAFAAQGNVMDLAVGVVIGAAFGKIVTAVVDDLIMPVIAVVTGGKKFTDNFLILGATPSGDVSTLEKAKAAGANVLAYGHLVQTIVDFLIIAFCIFAVLRVLARLQRKRAAEAAVAAPPAPSATEVLLTEIRDSLRGRS